MGLTHMHFSVLTKLISPLTVVVASHHMAAYISMYKPSILFPRLQHTTTDLLLGPYLMLGEHGLGF